MGKALSRSRSLFCWHLVALGLILGFSLSACSAAGRPAVDIQPVALTPGAETAVPAAVTPASQATAPAAEAVASAEPAVTFTISGGIVGFCDELNVTATGEYTLNSCQHGNLQGTLEPADQELLRRWHQDLAGFQQVYEDNPGGANNLASNLTFRGTGATEPEQGQKQAIFDWVNGLVLRLRPQPTPSPTTTPSPIGPEGLCPDVQRPAVVVANYDNPAGLIVLNPANGTRCDVVLHQPPFGRIVTAQGSIFYPVFNPDTKTITIWQLLPNGETRSLDFTQVPMEQFGPFNFVVSADGSQIAWARTAVDAETNPEAPVYTNDLWMAKLDGANQVTLLAGVQNNERRYVEPVRFSPDGSTLYYALQPDGLGGMIFSFSGRYDTMYRLPTTGGQPELMYACPEGEQAICIGDISADGTLLATAPHGQGIVQVIDSSGNVVSSVTPPATDYVGWPIFNAQGQLAFVSITLAESSNQEAPPRPNPGYISLVVPPYTGQPQTILSDDTVAALWEWLDDTHLVYGSMDQDGNIGTGMVTLDGQRMELSPNYALAVLR